MKQYLILLVFIVIFSGCLERDLEITLPYQEFPVAFGFLDSVHGVRVWAGKTAQILAKDSNSVTGAEIDLFQGNQILGPLIKGEKQIFKTSGIFTINPFIPYSFSFKCDQFPVIIHSNEISFPQAIEIKSIRFSANLSGQGKIDLFIGMDDPLGFNAYNLNITRFKKDTILDKDINSDPYFVPYGNLLQNDREFDGRFHEFRIENFDLDYRIDKRTITADSLQITLFNISKNMYDLFLSLNTPEPGSGDPFFDPSILPNQNKNGVAIMCSYNWDTKGVKVN